MIIAAGLPMGEGVSLSWQKYLMIPSFTIDEVSWNLFRILTLEISYQLRVEFLTQTKECLLGLFPVKHGTLLYL